MIFFCLKPTQKFLNGIIIIYIALFVLKQGRDRFNVLETEFL